MTQRLTDMEITRVSLVDKGANARVMAILKRQEEASMPDATVDLAQAPAGVIAWLRKQLGFADEPVAKAQTFAAVIAGQELSDALDDAFWTLRDVLWSAVYAYDENDQPLTLEAKRALVAKDLEEFGAYLLARMDGGIEKRDASEAALARSAVTAVVAKVGKKISGSRLERLQAAAEALTSVLDEVAEAVTDEAAKTAEEDTVEKADIVAAMTEALEPVTKRLDALEAKKVAKADPDPDGGDEGDDEPATLDTVVEVIGKLADRIDALEGSAGVRKSLAGQDGGTEPVAKKGTFSGILSR